MNFTLFDNLIKPLFKDPVLREKIVMQSDMFVPQWHPQREKHFIAFTPIFSSKKKKEIHD